MPAFALTTLCLAFGLTACGGSDGDSNTNVTTNPSNPTTPTNSTNTNLPIQNGVFNYTAFDSYVDLARKSAWGKLEYTLRDGSMTETILTVVGSSDYKLESDNTFDFRAGKGFFSAINDSEYTQVLGKYLKMVDGDTFQVTYPNTPLTESVDITSFDIGGKGKNPSNRSTGVLTDLDNYKDYFKATSYSFPQGSKCYVNNSKTNVASYFFYGLNNYDQMTLQQWLADEQKSNIEINGKSEKVSASDIVYESIGLNNDIPAVHFKDQLGNYHAAVVYQGKLYNADYSDGKNYDTPVNNTDLSKGPVECWAYNKVAADYLAEQMKASYGK